MNLQGVYSCFSSVLMKKSLELRSVFLDVVANLTVVECIIACFFFLGKLPYFSFTEVGTCEKGSKENKIKKAKIKV